MVLWVILIESNLRTQIAIAASVRTPIAINPNFIVSKKFRWCFYIYSANVYIWEFLLLDDCNSFQILS